MIEPRDYQIKLFYSHAPGDQCWVAQAIEWPTITAVGDTAEEAAHEILEALQLALDCVREDGNEPPMPSRLVDAPASR